MKTRAVRLLASTAGVVVGLWGLDSAAGQELYLLEGGKAPLLFRVDGPTGDVIDQVPVLGATNLQRGMARRWDGILYALDYDSKANENHLFRIDAETGEGATVGEPLPDLTSLAADPNTGVLYGATWNAELYRIDHQSGAATLIGIVEGLWPTPMAMAIGRDGVGYVTDWGNVALYRVDLTTAASEFVCYLGSGQYFNDMAFDGSGMLWGAFEWDGAIRRHDIDDCSGGVLYTGLWSIVGVEAVPEGDGCYSDCNGDDSLDLFDFLCFINRFNAGNPYSDCTGDGTPDLFDFLCFVNNFNAGC